MPENKAFMEREEWMVEGKMGFNTYCPVSAKAEAASCGKRAKPEAMISVSYDRDARSVLETHYDAELHQMTGYMRRLDGAYGKVKGGRPVMEPFADDGAAKWDIDPDDTALFGFWFYEAWHNVFSLFFSQHMGIHYASDLRSPVGCTAWCRGDDVSLESCFVMCVGNGLDPRPRLRLVKATLVEAS